MIKNNLKFQWFRNIPASGGLAFGLICLTSASIPYKNKYRRGRVVVVENFNFLLWIFPKIVIVPNRYSNQDSNELL